MRALEAEVGQEAPLAGGPQRGAQGVEREPPVGHRAAPEGPVEVQRDLQRELARVEGEGGEGREGQIAEREATRERGGDVPRSAEAERDPPAEVGPRAREPEVPQGELGRARLHRGREREPRALQERVAVDPALAAPARLEAELGADRGERRGRAELDGRVDGLEAHLGLVAHEPALGAEPEDHAARLEPRPAAGGAPGEGELGERDA